MDLTRRSFGKLVAAALAVWFGGLRLPAWMEPPLRFTRAAIGRFYPGRLKSPRSQEIQAQGRWLG